MLHLDGLTKRFGDVVALDGCTLSVRRGQMLGFLGPNGAGKTTTMRTIFGLVVPDAGEISWNDAPIETAVRLGFGYMPEERGLYPRMAVADQIVYFGRLHGMTRPDAAAGAMALLEEFGLEDRADSKVEVLKRRADAGAAVIFSSHQLDVVEDLCEEVVIVHRGKVVAEGSVQDLRAASPLRYLDVTLRGGGTGWVDDLSGVDVVERNGGRVRLLLSAGFDMVALARAAEEAGDVVEFTLRPPDLSEVFVEVTGS